MNTETLQSFRYCFQHILLPCAVAIGVLGNSVNVVVLTRRRMKCSTNMYLTALAISDLIYLLMVVALYFKYYPSIHHSKYELYWRSMGIMYWICDAASYASIYITVSFTVERYIAVCHPMKRQVICTESRAKKVIAVVVILCLAITCTTSFEYQLSTTQKYIDRKTGKPCNLPANMTEPATTILDLPLTPFTEIPLLEPESKLSPKERSTTMNKNDTTTLTRQHRSGQEAIPDSTTKQNIYWDYFYGYSKNYNETEVQSNNGKYNTRSYNTAGKRRLQRRQANMWVAGRAPQFEDGNFDGAGGGDGKIKSLEDYAFEGMESNASAITFNSTSNTLHEPEDGCSWVYFLDAVQSSLGLNETYKDIFMTISSIIFTFIPLVILVTFNCFLVAMVRRSNRLRDQMTGHTNSRQIKENRITVVLIGVVILFILCQTPTAIYILLPEDPNRSPEIMNLHAAIGNVLNFLITFNAASNFILYCVLSNKYRQTVKDLLLGRKNNRHKTRDESYSSRHGTPTKAWYRSSFLTRTNPKQISVRSEGRPTPKVVKNTKPLRNSFHVHPSYQHRPSLTPSITRHHHHQHHNHGMVTTPSRKSSEISVRYQDELCKTISDPLQNRRRSPTMTSTHLYPTDSCGSLPRSQSLILIPKTRHSPDCREYRINL